MKCALIDFVYFIKYVSENYNCCLVNQMYNEWAL